MNVSQYIFISNVLVCAYLAKCENGDIRLSGGTSVSNGRVEVCVNEGWGTICSDYWDNNDASVVCSQLGYSPYGMLFVTYPLYFLVYQVMNNEFRAIPT